MSSIKELAKLLLDGGDIDNTDDSRAFVDVVEDKITCDNFGVEKDGVIDKAEFQYTKDIAFAEINSLQTFYVDELISMIGDPKYKIMKSINFTSATGTGKTRMMCKLINKLPDYYFIITTLSKGQLHKQVRHELEQNCKYDNFYVYGSADYKMNSKIQAKDIISKIPKGVPCIWLRDEGHIKTNRFEELLSDVCYKIVNFSATNMYADIQCNFVSTMMLRTVRQSTGKPEDAIKKLLEVKETHKSVQGYNPCAIFRCVSGDDELYNNIISLCEQYGLKYIDITEDSFVMSELCEDDNEYDVIINKFKIVEGIDIRRAHVLFMDNQPGNVSTTIQLIGRCRRNALLYRDDIDILAPENGDLLKATRECYVYYNVANMKIDSDEYGELCYAFCNYISCEALKCHSRIYVENGQLSNGLHVLELENCTGYFDIVQDENTRFNVVAPMTDFYDTVNEERNDCIYTVNDRESAIVGVDLMRQSKYRNGIRWVESTTVTAKISSYNKFSQFLQDRYKVELESVKGQYFTGQNNFKFGKKCNSMVGCCVEYYSKYLLYGESYLDGYWEDDSVWKGLKTEYMGSFTEYFAYRKKLRVIRACMKRYREELGDCFGQGAKMYAKGFKIQSLVQKEFKDFVDVIVELGERTADFVRQTLYADCVPTDNVNPDLSIRHISGLADYITHDTILDVKVLNHINEQCVLQVLGYHYLSTKRSDLNIKRLIVYDVTSNRAVTIHIDR